MMPLQLSVSLPSDTLIAGSRKETDMISVVTLKNAHLFGPALPTMFGLRHKMFVERQGWTVPSFQNMEYDTYDNPAATYLIYQSPSGQALGLSRIAPTDRPYMLKDVWPHLVQTMDLPHSIDIWEASRFVIDKNLPVSLRTTIKHELVLSFLEYGLKYNIKGYVGVMSPGIWNAVFLKTGWKIEPIGPLETLQDGSRIYPGLMPVSQSHLNAVRNKTGLADSVLQERIYDDQETHHRAA